MSKANTAVPHWLEEMAHARKQSRASALRTWMLSKLHITAIGVLLVSLIFTWMISISPQKSIGIVALSALLFLAWPVLVLVWHLRVEIGLIISVSAVWWLLPAWWALWITVVIPVCALLAPTSRRWLVAQAWCVITRHRVTGILTRSVKGRGSAHAPSVVWSTTTRAGERLWVWLPSGVSFDDLTKMDKRIAAASWAQQCTITPHERFTHLSRIDLVRHDQLATPVTSPVADALGDELPTPQTDSSAAEKILSTLPKRSRRASEEFGKVTKGHKTKKQPAKTSPAFDEDPL